MAPRKQAGSKPSSDGPRDAVSSGKDRDDFEKSRYDHAVQVGIIIRELMPEAIALAQRAHELQGHAAFDSSKRAATLHEAGHAVVYTHEGWPVERLKVWRTRDVGKSYWLGWTTGARVGKATPSPRPSRTFKPRDA